MLLCIIQEAYCTISVSIYYKTKNDGQSHAYTLRKFLQTRSESPCRTQVPSAASSKH